MFVLLDIIEYEHMSELRCLRMQITRIVFVFLHLNRHPLDNFQAVAFEPFDLRGLFVMSRMWRTPRSFKICAPMP